MWAFISYLLCGHHMFKTSLYGFLYFTTNQSNKNESNITRKMQNALELRYFEVSYGHIVLIILSVNNKLVGFLWGPDALLRTPSPALLSARILRTRDIWLLGPRHDVKRHKPQLFYRKRLCVIHCVLVSGPACFSSRKKKLPSR